MQATPTTTRRPLHVACMCACLFLQNTHINVATAKIFLRLKILYDLPELKWSNGGYGWGHARSVKKGVAKKQFFLPIPPHVSILDSILLHNTSYINVAIANILLYQKVSTIFLSQNAKIQSRARGKKGLGQKRL